MSGSTAIASNSGLHMDLCSVCGVVEDADDVFFQHQKWKPYTELVMTRAYVVLDAPGCAIFLLESEGYWSRVTSLFWIVEFV